MLITGNNNDDCIYILGERGGGGPGSGICYSLQQIFKWI
jgi:hypothetical protein